MRSWQPFGKVQQRLFRFGVVLLIRGFKMRHAPAKSKLRRKLGASRAAHYPRTTNFPVYGTGALRPSCQRRDLRLACRREKLPPIQQTMIL